MNLKEAKKIHLVGIKGVGMTALAELLLAEKKQVSGSDVPEQFFTDSVLQKLGLTALSFNSSNVTPDIDIVVRSSAYGEDHPEIVEARQKNIFICTYAEAVAEIFNTHRGILITGSHGKTTTTAMTGWILEQAGTDPTVLVGAKVNSWGKNARVGTGEWMVAEGDEYQNKFLLLKPEILVITNIDYDHPDFFKTHGSYEEIFRERVRTMPKDGLLIAHVGIQKIIGTPPCKVEWFGEEFQNKKGYHWELDAEAAYKVAEHLGIPRERAEDILQNFMGTARRTEFYTKPDVSVIVIDDYAHHPSEIQATLAFLRRRYPELFITAVFQPHTYSRTQALFKEFTKSFADADEVVLLPIYSSAREHAEDFPKDLSEQLFTGIAKRHQQVKFVQSIGEAVEYAKSLDVVPQGRIIVTMGAGNVWEVAKALTIEA